MKVGRLNVSGRRGALDVFGLATEGPAGGADLTAEDGVPGDERAVGSTL